MSYEKTVWTNGSTPAINATNLNKIEQGIYDLNNLPNFRKEAYDISLVPLGSVHWVHFNRLVWNANEYDNSPDKVSNGMINQNGDIVIKKSGKYRILFTTHWWGGSGGNVSIGIYRNDDSVTNQIANTNAAFPSGTNTYITVYAQASFKLDQGDILQFTLFHRDDNTVTVEDISVCIECFELI